MKNILLILIPVTLIISCVTSPNKDEVQYEEVKKINTISAYGEFSKTIKNIDLQKRADAAAFRLAQKNDTLESYNEYLSYFENGKYKNHAKDKLK